MSEANVERERSERNQILGREYMLGSLYLIKFLAPVYGIGFWCYRLHGERSEPCNVYTKSCLPVYGSSIWLHYFALGNKSGGFCEAVNCERSEQEGKFLFAYLNGSLYLIKILAPLYGIGFWCYSLHGERSEPCNVYTKSCLPVYGSIISHWGTKVVAFVRQ